MDEDTLKNYHSKFEFYLKVLAQERNDKNKVYSLHEVDAYAINKGKDHKGYEFGTKASIATTKESAIIVGVAAHKENIHDSKTVSDVLDSVHKSRETAVAEGICDRGYVGVKQVSNHYESLYVTFYLMLVYLQYHQKTFIITQFLKAIEMIPIPYETIISIPSKVRKKDTPQELEIKRQKFRRRAAIEPVIGHLKSDHRMARNFLKGFKGDEINLLLAASAFNLKKWMRLYFFALYIGNYSFAITIFSKIRKLQFLQDKIILIFYLRVIKKC
nr:transposase [Sulfurimonas hydrogeniphila]